MSGTKAILDTNVIVYASKKLINIESILESYDIFYAPIITLMEVYGYNFKNKEELKLIDTLFENIEIIDIDLSIAQKAIDYRRNGKKKIKLPDAIILASANAVTANLITDDWDDFEGIDSTVPIIKIDNYKL